MYQSRYHFTNGCVSIAVDSLSGDVLEFVNLKSGDNILKNHCYDLPQPFCIKLSEPDILLFPLSSQQIRKDLSLQCEIDGDANGFTVQYKYLTDGKNVYPANVRYSVRFSGFQTLWNIEAEHAFEGGDITEVKFPCLNGMWLGEDWADDTLVYPLTAGAKWENPTRYFELPLKTIGWRWQEYRYKYVIEGCAGVKGANGTYEVRNSYPGQLSMTWMDYYDKDGGIYFASHDPVPRLTALSASTYGTQSPGIHLAVVNELTLKRGQVFSSADRVIAFHDGDWHDGADLYAAFKAPLLSERKHPEWFDKSAGLVAHYDFKYQNRQVVHRYADIPALREQAREMGLDHILLSGWHKHGFDNGFPLYYADEDMGTEEELAMGMQPQDDMHVSLYVNTWLSNTAYSDIDEDVAIGRDGKPLLCKFGDDNLTFGLMCPGAPGWHERMVKVAAHIENDWKGGIYFDMLSTHTSVCFSDTHGHSHDAICTEVKKLIDDVADGNICLMGEFVTDEYGGMIAGQLMQSFFRLLTGTYEEMYLYTFPKHILIDMLYPGKNLAMRPVFVAQKRDFLMHNHFVNGIYYWIYDLMWDNTFTRDPEGYEKLKKMIALRKFWLDQYGRGVFMDTKFLETEPQECMLRTYRVEGGILIACANASGEKKDTVCTWPNLGVKAVTYTPNDRKGKHINVQDRKIMIPADEFSLVYIEDR